MLGGSLLAKLGSRALAGRAALTKAAIKGRGVANVVGGRTGAFGVIPIKQSWAAERAGQIGLGALKGAAIGAIPGAALWGMTGNSDWMMLGAGAGAFRGAARAGLKGAEKMAEPNAWRKITNYTASGKMVRNLAIGSAIGVAQEDPNWAIYGAAGIPAIKPVAKAFYSPKGGLGMLKGTLQAPFAPGKAAETLSRVTGQQAFASAGFMGLVAGGASSVYNTYDRAASGYEPRDNSVTSGYFPGGTMALGQGRGPGIGNNHLSSEGLTLALHRNANKTRVI